MRRTFDADEICGLCGVDIHPQHFENRMNVFLTDGNCAFSFEWRGPGVYEGHSYAVLGGKYASEGGKEAIRLMQKKYGAWLIWGAPPVALGEKEFRAACLFNRRMGFTSLGRITLPDRGEAELFALKG